MLSGLSLPTTVTVTLQPQPTTSTATHSNSLWKQQPCIDHDVSVLDSHKHAVHANFPQAANGQHTQRGAGVGRWACLGGGDRCMWVSIHVCVCVEACECVSVRGAYVCVSHLVCECLLSSDSARLLLLPACRASCCEYSRWNI